MLEKFLISIGLKQPESIPESYTETTTTVRPTGENRFIDNENISDVSIHSPKDEVEIKALRSFSEIHNLGISIKEEFIVAMDIRDIPDQNERRRIIDFATGMVFMGNATMRSINRDGVFLILPTNASLSSEERERLQQLGLYKLNV
tara:strand:+ start:22 stop:459 length:438 start_codon:yes stop_codon:yes gene_type:complete